MEIRQVLKSSASMIPDLFYKVSEGQNQEEEKDAEWQGQWREINGRVKEEQRVELRRKAVTTHSVDVARCWKSQRTFRPAVKGAEGEQGEG